ncbi:MAG: signal peptidase I [Acidimicrobiia bacterium]|nr:signal peptidase I [Acidimicrobiia bacterium]
MAVVALPETVARPTNPGVGRRACRWAGAFGRALLLVTVAVSSLFFLFGGLGPRVAPYRVITVLTGSMRPIAPPGTLIVVTPIPLRDVRVGMVLTYQIPVLDHRVVTHRVIAVKDAGSAHPTITTKGDANNAPDPWSATLQGTTAWRMRAAIPKLGTAVRWLRSPPVHNASTWVVPLALAAIWLSAIWRRGPKLAPSPRGNDISHSSSLEPVGLAERLVGSAAPGVSTVMAPAGAAEAQAGLELARSTRVLGDQVAGEGGLPALVERGALHQFTGVVDLEMALGLAPTKLRRDAGGGGKGEGRVVPAGVCVVVDPLARPTPSARLREGTPETDGHPAGGPHVGVVH